MIYEVKLQISGYFADFWHFWSEFHEITQGFGVIREGWKMKYYSEETVRKIIKSCAHLALEQLDGYADEKLRHFPSIEIPSEPFGDLIDRDAILASDPLFFAKKYGGDHRRNYGTMMGYEIGNMLENAPVVVKGTKNETARL